MRLEATVLVSCWPSFDVIGAMERTPLPLSPSVPTPYQFLTMSSRAVVAPGSMVMVVCFTPLLSDGLNVSVYFCDAVAVLLMRMSDCQWVLLPSRWPTDGMISVLDGADGTLPVGRTGVTRLTDSGMATVLPESLTWEFETLSGVSVTRTVPVNVPFGRSEERRVGKECRTVCRSRWSPYH